MPQGLLLALLDEGGANQRSDYLVLAPRYVRQGVSHEMHAAALPARTQHLRHRLLQPLVRVGDDQVNAGEPAPVEAAQELSPECLGLGRPHRKPQHLSASLGVPPPQ